MKEELTEKMHSEFTIDAESDLKHVCFAALGCISDGMKAETAIEIYEIEMKDLKKNLDEYNRLFGKNVFLE